MIRSQLHFLRLAHCAAATIALAAFGRSDAADAVPTRPIHVLYVADAKNSAPASVMCAAIMEETGRDAIYLDFLNQAG